MNDWLKSLNEVNINLDEYEINELTELEKEKIKKNLKKKIKRKNNNYKKIVAALILALVGSVTFYNKEAIADKLEKVFSNNQLEDFTNYKDALIDDSRIVFNNAIKKDGLIIYLDEVVLDYEYLMITYRLEGEEKLKALAEEITPTIYLNDEEVDIKGFSGSYSEKGEENKLISLDLKEALKLKEKNVLKVVFGGEHRYFPQPEEFKNKIWEFSAEFNNLNLEGTTKKYKTDEKIELPIDGELFIDEIRKSKVSTNLKIKAKNLKEIDGENLRFIIENEKGERLRNISAGCRLEHIYDENENLIDMEYSIRARFINDVEVGDKIKIIPVILENHEINEDSEINKKLKDYSFEVNFD